MSPPRKTLITRSSSSPAPDSPPDNTVLRLPRTQEFNNGSHLKESDSSSKLLDVPDQALSDAPTPPPASDSHSPPKMRDKHDNALPAPEAVRVEIETKDAKVIVTVRSPGLQPKAAPSDPIPKIFPSGLEHYKDSKDYDRVIPSAHHGRHLQSTRSLTSPKPQKTPKSKKRPSDEKANTCTKITRCLSDYSPEMILVLSIASALPTALYALMGPSHKQPNDLGTDWWVEMNDIIRVISVICCGSSLAINGLMNDVVLTNVPNKIRMLREHKIKAAVSLFLASAATSASGKIAWDGSPSWAGVGGAVFNMLANGFTTLLTRSVGGAVTATEKIEGLFRRTERRDQMDLIEMIKDFGPEFKEAVQDYIESDPQLNELNDKTAVTILRHITELIDDRKGTMANETSWRTFWETWGSRFFAAAMAIIVFPVFTQKGFDGITAFNKLNPEDDYYIAKGIGIGLVPGIASSLFYYISCRETLPTIINAVRYLKRNKNELPLFVLWLVANFAASMSMFNIAQGTQDKPHGIFPFLKNLPALLFPILNAIAGGFVNGTFTIRRQFSCSNHTFNFDDFIRYCEQNVLPRFDSPVGKTESGVSYALDIVKDHLKSKADNESQAEDKSQAVGYDKKWCCLFRNSRRDINNGTLNNPLLESNNEDETQMQDPNSVFSPPPSNP